MSEYKRVHTILNQLSTSIYIDFADISYWRNRVLFLHKHNRLSDEEACQLNILLSNLGAKMGL